MCEQPAVVYERNSSLFSLPHKTSSWSTSLPSKSAHQNQNQRHLHSQNLHFYPQSPCFHPPLHLHLHSEDKSRGTTQTCTVKSNERSLKSGCAGMVKVSKFLVKFCFHKQLGGTNCNAGGQFVTFLRSGQRRF